jgi:hypothetical protein
MKIASAVAITKMTTAPVLEIVQGQGTFQQPRATLETRRPKRSTNPTMTPTMLTPHELRASMAMAMAAIGQSSTQIVIFRILKNAEVTSHSVVGDGADGSSTQGTPERKGFIPEMPEDYAPPWGTYRDPAIMAQNRLPFMTPIVERTESIPSMTAARNSIYNAKTPSKPRSPAGNLLLSSPLGTDTPYQGDHTVASTADVPFSPMAFKALAPKLRRREPIIRDAQCNPTDKGIRNTILNSLEKPLATYMGYHGHVEDSNYASMIQKFVKTNTRRSKSGGG